jgi:GNAT superfamily N-acetyltransferase
MFTVRKASADDIPLIRELTFKVWPQTYAQLLTKEQIDYMLTMMYSEASLQKQIEEDCITFIIVYDEQIPVAFAAYNEVKPQLWKLHKIYILQSQQGKGTGRFIIDYILTEIKIFKAAALQLQVKRDNPAQQFYKKLGFEIIETADFDIGNGYFMKDYIMQLDL